MELRRAKGNVSGGVLKWSRELLGDPDVATPHRFYVEHAMASAAAAGAEQMLEILLV